MKGSHVYHRKCTGNILFVQNKFVMSWGDVVTFLHKLKFRQFLCIRKANVKLKICEAKTYTNFLKKVDLSCMGKYCYNISISQKTLQVFIVWHKKYE